MQSKKNIGGLMQSRINKWGFYAKKLTYEGLVQVFPKTRE